MNGEICRDFDCKERAVALAELARLSQQVRRDKNE